MIDRATRRETVATLMAVADRRGDGTVPTQLVDTIAADLGVDRSTVYRWLQAERMKRIGVGDSANAWSKTMLALDEDHITVIYQHGGNLTQAKAALDKVDSRIADMSYGTFVRRWADQPETIRVGAIDGTLAVASLSLRTRYERAERNDMWHSDCMDLPVRVMPRGNRASTERPWMITILDDKTRRVMGWSIVMHRPTAQDVIATVAEAMCIRRLPEWGQFVGGLPNVFHSDNGGEFRSGQLAQALVRLGVEQKRIMPYHKQQNGKVERWHRTFQNAVIDQLPGATHGPKTLTGKAPFGEQGGLVLDEDALRHIVAEEVEAYNNRAHSSLGGKTPHEVWIEDTAPIRRPDPEQVRLAMLKDERGRIVQIEGVAFNNVNYTAPKLESAGLIGRKVDVRYWPTDTSYVEVFHNDEWVCTAVPHGTLTDAEKEQFQQNRKENYAQARTYLTNAAERRQVVFEKHDDLSVTYGDDGQRILGLNNAAIEDPQMFIMENQLSLEDMITLSDGEPDNELVGVGVGIPDVDDRTGGSQHVNGVVMPDGAPVDPFEYGFIDLGVAS